MNDEQFFLANAYLDGELTDEERRIAEADPEVMSEVEQLRALQSEVRDVPTAASGARESAIAAAMAEFDARSTPAETAVDRPRSTVPYRPRLAYAKYLGIAAAVVAVGVLGVVVAQIGAGGDDDDSAGGDDAAVEMVAEDRLTEDLDEADGGDAGGEDTADAVTDMADAAPADGDVAADDMAEADEAEEMSEEQAAEGEADDTGATAGDDGGEATSATLAPALSVPDDFDPDAPIADETDLAIYGAYLREQREFGRLGSTPNTPCAGDYEALRRASIVTPSGELVGVLVAVDDSDGTTLAVDEDSCRVLLDTAAP